MKLGLALPWANPRVQLPLERVLLAERLGFDSVWTAEIYGQDAITPLAFIAGHTQRIRLGTAVVQTAARTPAATALAMATVDQLAGGGRVIIGLGLSGPQIVEGWYGTPWGKPNARLRDYVEIVRKVLRREGPLSHDGPEIQLPYRGPGSSGLGKPLKSVLHSDPATKIFLGTGQPANVALTAELADVLRKRASVAPYQLDGVPGPIPIPVCGNGVCARSGNVQVIHGAAGFFS